MASESRRPYLIRAIYEWIIDNGYTPHMLVAADAEGVEVPQSYATEDGRITVNISPQAVQNLSLGDDLIQFNARFGGQPHNLAIPPGAVLAIYARENGEGMLFGEIEPHNGSPPTDSEPEEESSAKKKAPHLKVIK